MHFAVSALLRLPGLRIVAPTCADCVFDSAIRRGASRSRFAHCATILRLLALQKIRSAAMLLHGR
jgi:hypothetical protein